jgi:hypothetical protein
MDPPSPWAPRPPSRVDVEARFRGLLAGTATRDAVDRWAAQWVAAPGDPGVDDAAVWQALTRLFGVDAPQHPGGFLHSDDQIAEWYEEFRRAA